MSKNNFEWQRLNVNVQVQTNLGKRIMKTINFLEKMANHAHYDTTINELMATQPGSIKDAFVSNDSESLKNQISSIKFFANDCEVVSL